MANYLKESDDELETVNDLVRNIRYFCDKSKDIYGAKHIYENKAYRAFGDSIIITSFNREADVVISRSTTSNILNCFYEAPKLTTGNPTK